jgi:phosphate transport system substrate-binding protein
LFNLPLAIIIQAMSKLSWWLCLTLGLVLAACSASSNEAAREPAVSIQNKGSDTMVNLALAWAERYQAINPQVSISVTGGGTGTGITSLTNQTADIANASRKMKKEEIASLVEQGNKPVEYVVAKDAIAVIVNLNNPVDELTLQQISDIFSGKINNWKEVGGEDRPIVRLSRETNSGTHVYFLERVIRMGNKEDKTLFSTDTLLLPSSVGITSEVRDNPNAIGYDGLGYITSEEKMVAVSEKPGGPFVLPSADSVNQGTYPISRDLYMYTAGLTSKDVDTYLGWILTPEAQQIVTDLGFVPIIVP